MLYFRNIKSALAAEPAPAGHIYYVVNSTASAAGRFPVSLGI